MTEPERLAHRLRETAVLDVDGPDRESFLQGQLTQDVRGLAAGEARPAAALTPTGKLLFVARLLGLPEAIRLLLPAVSRALAYEHLRKFGAFQKVRVSDRSAEFLRLGIYGPAGPLLARLGAGLLVLPGEGEFSAEILAPVELRTELEAALNRVGSVALSGDLPEALRVEAGRPRFGQDIDSSNLPDEAGLGAAISPTKGCYVGQEVVARRRTYGRINRRLVGFRFPEGLLAPGATLRRSAPTDPAGDRIEAGRITSSVLSPRIGPIGLGFAFHDVPVGGRLLGPDDPPLPAVVSALPFA